MPLVLKDRVKETSTTTGTGTLTLGGAATGFQSFSVVGNGNTTYYAIVDSASGAWEVGIGTYTASGTLLSRDTVLESSTGGAKVSFAAGAKDVFVTYPAETSVTDLGVSRPTIRPSLLLDFANTEALDPRITFARASTATYYNGVTTAKAEENLLIRSQDYSATWTVTNLTPVTGKTAPDATSTATEFTASAANAVLTQGYTAIAGSYTFSVFLRRVTGSGDIQIAADNGTWTTKVITGTWARYDVTQTVAAGSKTAGVRVVTSTDAIEVWGAQLEQRSAVTAYTPTTTQPITTYVPVLLSAANNVARFDHNPVTGESLGLLIEEQRTNLFVRSEEFNDAAWTKADSTITANTVVAPDGALTGDKLVENAVNSTHSVATTLFTFTSGTSYTLSLFVKAAERTSFDILRSGPGGASASFDLTTLTATSLAGSPTMTIVAVGNGWYRCTMSWSASATANRTHAIQLNNPAGTATYTGDGYSGLYIWGAQLEAGAFPTSYIATVASQVTRSADAASMTGANFSSWFSNAEGAVYSEIVKSSSNIGGAWDINAGSTANSIRLTPNNTTQFYRVTTNSTEQTAFDIAASSNGSKSVITYKVNDVAASVNGGAVSVDSSVVLPVVDRLLLGSFTTPGANNLNGTIKKLSYYTRRLTNAELQGLTS
jgi:hypothetical protein